jgi:uncharacterized metal-binding protein
MIVHGKNGMVRITFGEKMNDENEKKSPSPIMDKFLEDVYRERMELVKAINEARTDIYQHRRRIQEIEDSIKAMQERIVIIDHLRLADNNRKNHFEEQL